MALYLISKIIYYLKENNIKEVQETFLKNVDEEEKDENISLFETSFL